MKLSKKKRILIINRGEIASRIAKAVRELEHIAVGVWTDNEINAPHLQFCHEWLKLEGSNNAETYLNISQILNLVKKEKIDAVHPGYGFLAENAEFAEELEKIGTIFIGPNPTAIRMMGDKAISKKKALESKVPVVPGSVGAVDDLEEAFRVSEEVGYPILLKAVAGGGGKGMRACFNKEDVEKNFDVVQRESLAAFGNKDLLVEKLILNPRHIEIQVLGDKKGNLYHFFERECSIQRRHQKIVEEAPSPFIGEDEKLREKICETAIRLAKEVNYDSAGTVEFIMGEDKSFYFLEMNTRIQVEHPVTEEITGIDLIVCMIQSALEEDLGIPNQEWIRRSGHAIECRICAEDPVTMLPAPGKLTGFDTCFPQGTRFDNCLYPGLVVTPDFDPMVGKLIVEGINRDVAMRKMRAALEGLLIEGLKTNVPLLKVILRNEAFSKGNYSTNFIEKEKPQNQIDKDINIQDIFKKLAIIEARKIGL
ncbi:ATP-grasp domain-containing protein [Bacteriovoracales bacterium]|nr:ATP-grasp domain-containing protein [Bacteriovoracales bacterium]